VPEHVRVVLNGVDLERFRPPVNKDEAKRVFGWEGKKVIGVVSTFSARKRIEDFLRISAKVARVRPDVLCIVAGGAFGAGEEDHISWLKRRAVELGIEGKVVWPGFQADVRPCLSAFDVFCHVAERESCSRAILEAMATGLAVVVYDDSGNPELVGREGSGVLVPLGDEAGFANNLIELLAEDEKRIAMGSRARMRAEACFSAERNAKETMALYEELLGQRGHI
jgi:mannosyltransferase